MHKQKSKNLNKGFTIVELLIVVVVIAILAAITIVSYNSITKRSTESLLKADLNSAAKKLGIIKVDNGSYPSSLSGIKFSEQVNPEYTGPGADGLTFCLTTTAPKYPGMAFNIDQNGSIKEGACSGHWNGVPLVATDESCFVFRDYPSDTTKAQITNYNNAQSGCGSDVVIPGTLGGKPVASISSNNYSLGYGFNQKGLTSVTIPNSVTSIGTGAFNNNQLPDDQAMIFARLPNGLVDSSTLVSYGGAKRSGVTIPNSVTSIGDYAFWDNQLTSVTIPNSVTSIGNYAFYTNRLTSVTIPNSVTSIGYYAFHGNQLTSVTIPNSVTSIGQSAFRSNRLTSVTIPNSVTSIGIDAFYFNQLTSVTIPNSVTSIGEYAFYGNQLTSVTIPNSVTSIGISAFAYNQLTSVTIPNSVTSIGSNAFASNPRSPATHSISCRVPTGKTTLGTTAQGCASQVFYTP